MNLEMCACVECGVLFKPRNIQQKYHSKACREVAQKHRMAEERKSLEYTSQRKICLSCNQEKPLTAFTSKNAKKCFTCHDKERRERERKKQEKRDQRIEKEIILSTTKKVCNICGKSKYLFEFSRNKESIDYKDKMKTCKECTKYNQREKYRNKKRAEQDKERKEEQDFLLSLPFNDRVACQQRKIFERYIKTKYGITIERYDAMVSAQNNVCAICGNPPEKYTQLVVDHNHETGAVRGLLCPQCNFGLGNFKDNVAFLQNAIDYLKKFAWLEE